MFQYREVIELRSVGLSYEKVAYLTGCSIQKAKKIVSRAVDLGLEWPVPVELNDNELQRLVDESPSPRFHPIDFDEITQKAKIGKKRRKRGDISDASLQKAWEAYLESAEKSGLRSYSRSGFNRKYKNWLRTSGMPLKMLVNWTPAEEVQVDWAGRTIPIYGKAGEVTPAYLFVATMPYSGYTFVRASLDMSMQSWLEHHCALFEFLGGVPMFIVPDNLATAVTFKKGIDVSLKERRSINHQYQEMADYYGVLVAPTRVSAPKDKGAVEAYVRFAANYFAGLLKQLRFTSIEQLNNTIVKLTEVLNDRMSLESMFDITRKEAFLHHEVPYLAPLPSVPFSPATWVDAKASAEAVITVRGVYYGLPLSCAGKEVKVCISNAFVDVYALDSQQKVAHHVRGEDGSHTFEGFAGRRPDRFKPLSEWAEQNSRHALLEQWHLAKNEGLTPGDVVCFSGKKVWWRCGECGYEWQETPRARVGRAWDDCLACANVDLVPGRNDLATLYPEIAAEWHPTKNGCEPSEVFPDQTLNMWWKGSECGHEWLCGINERTKSALGRLCPYCSGKKALPGFNDVKTLCPELAALWHPYKNRKNKPDAIAVLERYRAFLQEGLFGVMWLESPRSWMLRNGYADVLEPFLRRIAEAKEEDASREANHGPADPHASSKLHARSRRHNALWMKTMSLKEWCESFGREYLLEEWHPVKNGINTPKNTTHGSNLKAWWLCPKCGHEWEDHVFQQKAKITRCPACASKWWITPGLSDLASRSVSFLKFYSPDNELPPERISNHHRRPLWWECPDCGKKWKASLDRFPEQRGSCPFCDKWVDRLRCAELEKLDLASRFPQIAAFWHPSKNDGLQPNQVRPYSLARVWWLCPHCGREWRESVKNCLSRANTPCPFCFDRWNEPILGNSDGSKAPILRHFSSLLPGFNDLATVNPVLAAEWHPTKNGNLTPLGVTPGSRARVWWQCEKGHEWEAVVGYRTKSASGCPYCCASKRRVHPDSVVFIGKTLATARPEIVDEWHPEKNGTVRPEDVKAGSRKKLWWRCEKGHEWEASAFTRSRGDNCPYCSNHRLLAGYNDLATLYSHIAEQWHPEKNGLVGPSDVLAGSKKKYWWRCEKGHEWEAAVFHRTGGHNCPYCSNQRLLAGYNDLATLHPRIAEQWHPEKNGLVGPSDVLAGSKKKYWWRCEKGHEWEAAAFTRSGGENCPYCSNHRLLAGYNDLATLYSHIAEQWHPTKNDGLKPSEVLGRSKKEAWWLCPHCGESWLAKIARRTATKGYGCPECTKKMLRAKKRPAD